MLQYRYPHYSLSAPDPTLLFILFNGISQYISLFIKLMLYEHILITCICYTAMLSYMTLSPRNVLLALGTEPTRVSVNRYHLSKFKRLVLLRAFFFLVWVKPSWQQLVRYTSIHSGFLFKYVNRKKNPCNTYCLEGRNSSTQRTSILHQPLSRRGYIWP